MIRLKYNRTCVRQDLELELLCVVEHMHVDVWVHHGTGGACAERHGSQDQDTETGPTPLEAGSKANPPGYSYSYSPWTADS